MVRYKEHLIGVYIKWFIIGHVSFSATVMVNNKY